MTSISKHQQLALLVAAAVALPLTPLAAQATRTWVSGTGSDANPCSRTAPCQTFAGAISKTASAGEINCLDPGGFGTVNITKSITIDCAGTMGSILASNTNGVIVNAAGINVILRNIVINNASTTTGNGIRFINGASLVVENVVLENAAGTVANGAGIRFEPSGAAELYVTNTTITNNTSGILIKPTGTGSATASVHNADLQNNGTVGFSIDLTGNTGTLGVNATLNDSVVANSTTGVTVVTVVGTAGISLTVTTSNVTTNPGTGILANGPTSSIRVGGSTISGNGTGVLSSNGGTLQSFGDNYLAGNVNANGAFTPPVIPRL